MRRALLAAAALLVTAAAGCSTLPPADGVTTADDPVCAYEGDLGCVRVKIEADTPHAEYAGRTYYFCCDACRERFEEDPAKYAPR